MLTDGVQTEYVYSDKRSTAYTLVGKTEQIVEHNKAIIDFSSLEKKEDVLPLSEFLYKRKYSIAVFVITVLVRMVIFFISYKDPTIKEAAGFNIDFINHVLFVQDIFNGIFFYHPLYGSRIFYSPVTPVLISVFAFPLVTIFNVSNIVDAVIISTSIFMGIKAVGTYLLLREYNMNTYYAMLLVIFNPWELVGVIPWGGLSLLFTTTAITYSLLVYRKMEKDEITKNKGIKIISLLLLLSVLAHRTGIVVQLTVIFFFALFKLKSFDIRSLNLRKIISNKFNILFVSIISSFLVYIYNFRINGRVHQVVLLGGEYYIEKILYFYSSIVDSLPLVVVTAVGIYLHSAKKKGSIKLNDLERSYLYMSLFYIIIPFVDNDINSRFFLIIDSLLLYFWALVENTLRTKFQAGSLKKRYYILFLVFSIIMSICIFVISIQTTKEYIAYRIAIRHFFFQ